MRQPPTQRQRLATRLLKLFGWKVVYVAPLGLAFIDYPRRAVGIVDYLALSGDPATDLARIADVYAGRRGKYPAQEGCIAFGASGLAEDQAADAEDIDARK